jgi:hypothetical protein
VDSSELEQERAKLKMQMDRSARLEERVKELEAPLAIIHCCGHSVAAFQLHSRLGLWLLPPECPWVSPIALLPGRLSWPALTLTLTRIAAWEAQLAGKGETDPSMIVWGAKAYP